MRGGKRQGAGRKAPYGKTKVYRLPEAIEPQIMKILEVRLPEAIEPQIMKILEDYKKGFDSVTKSKTLIEPSLKPFTKHEKKVMTQWLISEGFARSPAEVRKMIKTPKKAKETFLKYVVRVDEVTGDMLKLADRYVEE